MDAVVHVIVLRLRATSLSVKHNSPINKRNQLIRELYAGGMTQTMIAARFGITSERVSQIVHYKR